MTGIEPAYSAWEAISSAGRLFESAWSGRRLRTGIPATSAVLVRLAHGYGSAPVRLRFGRVGGTDGVSADQPIRDVLAVAATVVDPRLQRPNRFTVFGTTPDAPSALAT